LHWSVCAEQSFGVVFWHKPLAQWSLTVQGSPSSQATMLGSWWQPSAVAQWSSVQGLLSSQFLALPPAHAPETQISPTLQASPSSQLSPSRVGLATHRPLLGSQLPTWHWPSIAVQSITPLPAQLPAWH
jgi:hypothetical protein